MRIFLKILVLIGLVIGGRSKYVVAQYSFSETPLLQVLEELSRKTEYILLYRESLVHGIDINVLMVSEENVFDALQRELRLHGLDLMIDERLRQVVIFRLKNLPQQQSVILKGYIVDARSGERLPFATLSWQEVEGVAGIAANEAGYFVISISEKKDRIEIKASYIGYESIILEFSRDELNSMSELTIRLLPETTSSEEVIITGLREFTNKSGIKKTVDIAQGTILGESNTIKSLQQLPSVTIGPAMSGGLNVRGSPSDGFQVMLDGVTIYNQTHLFGLFDNFNADALQTSGLYYGITPASYQGPIGGTLSLLTRTGSVNEFRADIGVSNTSFNATLEGPIVEGRASFLLSGRSSYIDQLNWFGNANLVRWGLDVDRPSDYLSPESIILRTDLLRPNNSSALFGDIHLKFNMETRTGSRFMISGYYGYDDILVNAERLYRSFSGGQGNQLEYQPVTSENSWKNGKLSGHFQHRLNDQLFNKSIVGWSVFNTHFSKDDFTYTQINPGTGTLESFTSDITIKSILNEFIFREELEWIMGNTKASGGLSYQYYKGEYFEDSFERPSYFKTDNAYQIDSWLHSEFIPFQQLSMSGGIRTHYYSNGKYFNLSPRLNARILPQSMLSFGGGYSRNFQYVNRVSFSNVLSSDVWILLDEQEPPAFVDNLTAGIYFEREHLLVQLEGYRKEYEHLRLHEIDTYSVTNALSSSPWFTDNTGAGKGLEFMLINSYDQFEINQSLTLSRMEIQNPDINNGVAFPADWNRNWQYTGSVKVRWFNTFETILTQVYATGTPNKLSVFGEQEREQLGDYYRTDLRITYEHEIGSTKLDASISFYNLLDVENPWYREFGFGLDESSGISRFVSVPLEVYDLGFQPSFSISVSF